MGRGANDAGMVLAPTFALALMCPGECMRWAYTRACAWRAVPDAAAAVRQILFLLTPLLSPCFRYLFGGSAILFNLMYHACGLVNKQGAKSKSCWLSHVHCIFTVPSACLYWLTQPVDFWSTQWMIEGPAEAGKR